jgi:1-aminocyclopropane-1-carboxylate deaminase
MNFPDTGNSLLQEIPMPGNCRVWMKRDDLIHPFISGNKWRKLRLYMEEARQQGVEHIITAGGPFSNHILATASACAVFGIRCTALIRGRQQPDNHYRIIGTSWNLNSVYLSHEEFNQRMQWVREHHPEPKVMFIDVGGAGEPGAAGCEDIWDEFPFVPDALVLATATSTTMQGIISGRDKRKLKSKVVGVPVLFNETEQREILESAGYGNWALKTGFERGGFAKADAVLMQFIQQEIQRTNILFDPVYTGKAWMALRNLLEGGYFEPESNVVFLHTGGTLGLFSQRYLDFLR